jgi:hypothetical protein
MSKYYRILKDTPDANKGTILSLNFSHYCYTDKFGNSNMNYPSKSVEPNVDWFEQVFKMENSYLNRHELLELVKEKYPIGSKIKFMSEIFKIVNHDLIKVYDEENIWYGVIKLRVDKKKDELENKMINNLLYILKQVDLSCCGVYYHNNEFSESIDGSLYDCLKKEYSIIPENSMYQNNRIMSRYVKMQDRGWKCRNSQEMKYYS